jgi:hypothetical protein
MPLQFTNVDVPLGGLDQKIGPLVRVAGALEQAINVEFDKSGQLNKRRGYQFVDMGEHVGAFTNDEVMAHLGVLRGELVIFTRGHVAGLGSREGELRGEDTIVYRGPNNCGGCSSGFVSVSRLSDEYLEDGEE